MMKKILVMGGTRFFGKHLLEHMIRHHSRFLYKKDLHSSNTCTIDVYKPY